MSKTHCRFCELSFEGLYLNCPKCGKWLAPQDIAPGEDIEPDPNEQYEVINKEQLQVAMRGVKMAALNDNPLQVSKIDVDVQNPMAGMSIEDINRSFKAMQNLSFQISVNFDRFAKGIRKLLRALFPYTLASKGYIIVNKRGRNKLVDMRKRK